MDSKEQILEKYCDKRCFLSIDGHPDNKVIDGDAEPVLEAMDAWAKEVAVDFCKWRMKQTLSFLRDEAGMFPEPEYTLEDEFNKYLQYKK